MNSEHAPHYHLPLTICRHFRSFLLCAVFLVSTGLITHVEAQDLDVPYVPTPQKVVEHMLDVVDLKPSDYVIDLGSGDGRIVIAAARRGATGHGIDLDPERVGEARANAEQAGVDKQVMFMQENIFDTDFSRASVITMYLLPTVNEKLRPELLDKLEPGTRVVSHSFDMDEWKPDKQLEVRDEDGDPHDIYYWVIPTKVDGAWSWTSAGRSFTLKVKQQFQEITASLADGNGRSYSVEASRLHGDRLTIRATNGEENLIFSGRVEGDTILGTMQVHNGQGKSYATWTATRR